MTLSPDDIIDSLGLVPLPHEGGLWAQSYRDESSSAIYFLLRTGDFSAMHRLTGTEIWHFHAGAPAKMLLLHPSGEVTEPILGTDLASGERPQVAVSPGVWQGASTAGEWTLVGTTMTPPYEDDCFELGNAENLVNTFPTATNRIEELTR